MRVLKRTERSTILGANRRVANAKSSILQDNNPNASCMHEMHGKRTERKSSVVSYWSIKAHHSRITLTLCAVVYFGKPGRYISIYAFVLRTQRAVWMLDMCWFSPTLLACVVALWSARTCFAALGWLCCAVLCLRYLLQYNCSIINSRCSTTTCSYMVQKKAHKNIKKWKSGSSHTN